MESANKFIDSLITEIETASNPGSVTNEMVARVFRFFYDRLIVSGADLFDELWAVAASPGGDVVDPGETYALNTVRDLTRADAMRILTLPNFIVMNGAMCVNQSIRTNLPVGPGSRFTALGSKMIDLSHVAAYNTTIEDLFLWGSGTINYVSNMAGAFMAASNLRKVTGMINVERCTDLTDAFKGCYSLEDISIDGLKVSLDLSDCPKISYASLWCIVENATNTDQIEIRLDADLYDKITSVGTNLPVDWTCNGGTAEQWREFFAACDDQHINIRIN